MLLPERCLLLFYHVPASPTLYLHIDLAQPGQNLPLPADCFVDAAQEPSAVLARMPLFAGAAEGLGLVEGGYLGKEVDRASILFCQQVLQVLALTLGMVEWARVVD